MSVLGNVKKVKRCKDTDSFCFFPIIEKKSYLCIIKEIIILL